MEFFQKSVLIIAIVILILILIFIGVNLAKARSSQPWPPVIPECPDYWEIDGSGNDARCVNVLNLGTCQAATGSKYQEVNFNTPEYTGENGSCAKYTWADNCKVSWDGITYGVDNPCIKPPTTS